MLLKKKILIYSLKGIFKVDTFRLNDDQQLLCTILWQIKSRRLKKQPKKTCICEYECHIVLSCWLLQTAYIWNTKIDKSLREKEHWRQHCTNRSRVKKYQKGPLWNQRKHLYCVGVGWTLWD